MAKIELVFRPILSASPQSAPNLTGAYHEFVIYTHDSGKMYFTSGGPENGLLTTGHGEFLPGTFDAPILWTADNVRVIDWNTYNSYYKIELKSGSNYDVGPVFDGLTTHMEYIKSLKGPYQVTSQNSNAAITDSIRSNGLEAPNTELGRGPINLRV